MNNFKRILALVMVLVAVMSLAACASTEDSKTTTAPQTSASAESSTPDATEPDATEPDATEPESDVTFRVQVVDEAGNPVVGAGVQLCLETCVTHETNEEGWAVFDNPVENGYKANIAYLTDGTDVSAEPVYFEDGSTELVLTLTVTYRIQVVDAEGKPVEGETVTLVNKDAFVYTAATTDAEGYAVFYNLIAEGYQACFGDHSDMKLDGVELIDFEAEATEIVLTKAAA